MSATTETVRRLTVVDIAKLHADGERIPMLTAYDYPTAQLLDEAGIPLLLVGDSLGRVMLGYENDGPGDDGRHAPPHEGRRRAAVERALDRRPTCRSCRTRRPTRPSRTPGASCARPAPRPSRSRAASGARGSSRRSSGRHPGHGPHRPDAAGDQPGRQGPRPGQDPRPGSRRSSPTRSRSRRPARSRSSSSSCPSSSPPRSPSACASRRSASAPGPGCSGQVQVITDLLGLDDWHPEARAAVRRPARRRSSARRRRYAADVAAGSFPGPSRDGPHGRRRPRRGPRPDADRSTGPAGTMPGRRASRSIATSRAVTAAWCRSSAPARSCAPRWARRHGRSASCRRWAGSTTAIDRCIATGAGRGGHDASSRSSSTRASSTRRRTTRSYPRDEAAGPRDLRGGRASTSCSRQPVEEIYPPGFDTVVRVGAIAQPARGRRAAGPLRRRRDGRRDPVQPRRRRAGVLRPEGRPAGDGHPPDGPRPGDRDRGRRLPDRPRARRPRALVAQRPPLARGAGRGAGPPSGAARRHGHAGSRGERSGDALRAAMRDQLAAEPLADVDYV